MLTASHYNAPSTELSSGLPCRPSLITPGVSVRHRPGAESNKLQPRLLGALLSLKTWKQHDTHCDLTESNGLWPLQDSFGVAFI